MKQTHLNSKKKPKETHGIDLYFSYRSHLESFTVNHVIISVKYSNKPYPAPPTNMFKNHFRDLAETVECFSKSEFKSNDNKNYEYTGIKKGSDIGVLFCLNNDKESDQDIVSKISNIVIDKKLNFSTIHVVDNAKAAFIYNSIELIKRKFNEHEIFFHHSFSSSNFIDPDVKKFGSILPVEYLTSPVLPFRVIHKNNDKQTFCISCIESFNENSAKRLINLASDISQEFSGDFIIIFSRYDYLNDKPSFDRAMRSLGEFDSRMNIEAISLENDFRSLVNE